MNKSFSAFPPSSAFPEPRFPLITVVLVGQIKQLTLKYATINIFNIFLILDAQKASFHKTRGVGVLSPDHLRPLSRSLVRLGQKVCSICSKPPFVRKLLPLTIALFLLGSATVGIALLPGYESIGVAAIWWLVGLRVAQGLAVGGSWEGLPSLLAMRLRVQWPPGFMLISFLPGAVMLVAAGS